MSGHRWIGLTRLVSSLVLAGLCVVASAQERAGAGVRSDIVVQALSLLGTPYRYGGTSPEAGFDCSGLVRHVFGSVLNWDMPRRSEEISGLGESVARAELQPGDLVFFNTLRRAFSHVAIYVGDGRFVHAPAKSGRVRIEGLDDRYWSIRFDGARRVVESVPAAGSAEPKTAPAASGVRDSLLDRPPGP